MLIPWLPQFEWSFYGEGAWQVGAGYILRNGGARISEDCGAELPICSLLYLQLLNREEAVGNSGLHIMSFYRRLHFFEF